MGHEAEDGTVQVGDPSVDGGPEYLVTRRYDPGSSAELVNYIVESVAMAAGVSSDELAVPLYEVVDVDAIENLFKDFGSPTARVGHVMFEYEEYTVIVRSDGFVGIR